MLGNRSASMTTCVFNWEAGISTPEIRYMPLIIQFLGYSPLRGRRPLEWSSGIRFV